MATYHGSVVDGRIQLDIPLALPEGVRVTILVPDVASALDPEAALDQELVEEGLLSQPCAMAASGDFLAYQPVDFQGEPLSKTLVEERR
jgi:hypothetical protein